MGETPPKLFRGPEMDYDVFICHASEDKETIVRPLLKALVDSGIRVWVDEQEIKWGDSVPGRINKGLENSRFVIIVLSKHFLEKQWTQAELDAVLSTEINDGVAIALPLMVGKKSEHHEILRRIPLLRSKLYLPWASNDAGAVVAALKSRLSQVS